jgi:catechol 2,3-dioxygenase-like lactoylglutathione lyase family enzyme
MRVRGLVWVGTRTAEHDATARFFREVMGLGEQVVEPDFSVLDVPGGATVEVFGPTSEFNRHLTHPVVGFRVDDVAAAAAELEAAGVEIVLPLQRGGPRSWLHFRAPDGFVYELAEDRAGR